MSLHMDDLDTARKLLSEAEGLLSTQRKDRSRTYREMLEDFLTAVLKAQGSPIDSEAVETRAMEIVEGCYKSFLDPDFNIRLAQILPALNQ